MTCEKINRISNKVLRGVGIVITILGVVSFVPEFTKIQNFINKRIEISYALIAFIISCIICLVSFMLKNITNQAIDIKNQNNDLITENRKLREHSGETTVSSDSEIYEALKKFVENMSYVLGVQIYKCTERIVGSSIQYNITNAEYKYIRPGENVNDIRETYKINKKSLEEYRNLKKNCLSNLTQENKEICARYVGKLTTEINNAKSNKITETMINNYCFSVLTIQNMIGKEPIEINNIDKKLQERINKAKRNGFLRGIIEQDMYRFRNKRNANKDRIYITKCLDIKDCPHIFVITLEAAVMEESNYSEYMNRIGTKFYEILTNDLSIVYNDYRVS